MPIEIQSNPQFDYCFIGTHPLCAFLALHQKMKNPQLTIAWVYHSLTSWSSLLFTGQFIHFFQEWGEQNNIKTLKNLTNYLQPALTHININGTRVILGRSHKNNNELAFHSKISTSPIENIWVQYFIEHMQGPQHENLMPLFDSYHQLNLQKGFLEALANDLTEMGITTINTTIQEIIPDHTGHHHFPENILYLRLKGPIGVLHGKKYIFYSLPDPQLKLKAGLAPTLSEHDHQIYETLECNFSIPTHLMPKTKIHHFIHLDEHAWGEGLRWLHMELRKSDEGLFAAQLTFLKKPWNPFVQKQMQSLTSFIKSALKNILTGNLDDQWESQLKWNTSFHQQHFGPSFSNKHSTLFFQSHPYENHKAEKKSQKINRPLKNAWLYFPPALTQERPDQFLHPLL
jgi:hypothetical protein